MDLSNLHPQEIIQMPVVLKKGIIQALSPDLLKADESTLKNVAVALGGELIYLKMRATYTAPENMLCVSKDCWRKAAKDADYCEDHT